MSDKKPVVPTEKGVQPPIGAQVEKGTVAETRRAPLIGPEALWSPPAEYRPLDKASIEGVSKIAEISRRQRGCCEGGERGGGGGGGPGPGGRGGSGGRAGPVARDGAGGAGGGPGPRGRG